MGGAVGGAGCARCAGCAVWLQPPALWILSKKGLHTFRSVSHPAAWLSIGQSEARLYLHAVGHRAATISKPPHLHHTCHVKAHKSGPLSHCKLDCFVHLLTSHGSHRDAHNPHSNIIPNNTSLNPPPRHSMRLFYGCIHACTATATARQASRKKSQICMLLVRTVP